MADWMLGFGPSALGLAWVVEREDGTGASAVFEADAHEDARRILVRRARADEGIHSRMTSLGFLPSLNPMNLEWRR